MLKRIFTLCVICAVVLVAGAGCGKKAEDASTTPTDEQQEETKFERAPGDITHMTDYPVVETLAANNGDYVLAPSELMLDEPGVVIYYGATVSEKGEKESKLKRLSGGTESLPNAVIVPIKPNQKASVGDILLTWWQSGSGMERAIVTGGSADQPTVMYLDIDYDNPSGAGQEEDTLKPDTFHKLSDGDIGTGAACLDEGDYVFVRVTGEAEGKLLTDGFAGTMKSYSKEDCKFIPVNPNVKAGDTVFVPIIGTMSEAVVESVDPKIGRVFVTYDWVGTEEKAAIAFGSVMKELR